MTKKSNDSPALAPQKKCDHVELSIPGSRPWLLCSRCKKVTIEGQDFCCGWAMEMFAKYFANRPSPALAEPAAPSSVPPGVFALKQVIQVCHNILLTELGRKCAITEDKCWICKEVEAAMADPEQFKARASSPSSATEPQELTKDEWLKQAVADPQAMVFGRPLSEVMEILMKHDHPASSAGPPEEKVKRGKPEHSGVFGDGTKRIKPSPNLDQLDRKGE